MRAESERGGRALAAHALWNVLGTALPALAGVVALPLFVRFLDGARLGAFGLALGLVGFAGLLDFGLGRGITLYVAAARGEGRDPRVVRATVVRVLWLLSCTGAVAGAMLWIAAPWLAAQWIDVPGEVRAEFTLGLRWIAIALPPSLCSVGMVAALEGEQRFARVNAWRAPLSAGLFLVPLALLMFTRHLDWLIGALAAVRFAGAIAWAVASRPWGPRSTPEPLRGLLRFSGWIAVSNVVGPLMVWGDRFFLATQVPIAALAAYTVPHDAASRASSLPAAAINALFPALARRHAASTDESGLIDAATRTTLMLWAPMCLVAVFFCRTLCAWWLTPDFARDAAPLLQILLVGVYLNGASHLPMAVLHACERSDVTARLHLFELPFYAALLVLLTARHGLLGAAVAWSARVLCDAVALHLFAARHATTRAPMHRALLWQVGVAGLLAVAAWASPR